MPLCYNFLYIAGLAASGTKVYYAQVFGSMDVSFILGQWFNRYIPVFIPVVALLIQFKLFDKLMILVGVDSHNPDEEGNDTVEQRIREGRLLIMSAASREMTRLTPPSTPGQPGVDTEKEKGWRYREYLKRKAGAGNE